MQELFRKTLKEFIDSYDWTDDEMNQIYTLIHLMNTYGNSKLYEKFEQHCKSNGLQFLKLDVERSRTVEQIQLIESIYNDALEEEEFMVFFQPKVDLHNYSLIGAEALVRWDHQGVIIFPDEFIPVLEENESISSLDFYMLKHVCIHIREWLDEGKKVPQISVNLSRSSVSEPDVVEKIVGILDEYKIPHALIQIELTESAQDRKNEALRPLVEGLAQYSICTAVDDFGTGFSSLSLIRELPWKVLKIDKSLLKGAQKAGSREQIMFKTIIQLARDIGLRCIVEGVESREDVKLLKESECFFAQGFYFSRPLPKHEFEKLMD